jgi:hypothetical protein
MQKELYLNQRREKMIKKNSAQKIKVGNKGGPLGFIFFAAWVGALVYFVQNSVGFWGFILAVLKSTVWPAFVVHAVLKLLAV